MIARDRFLLRRLLFCKIQYIATIGVNVPHARILVSLYLYLTTFTYQMLNNLFICFQVYNRSFVARSFFVQPYALLKRDYHS